MMLLSILVVCIVGLVCNTASAFLFGTSFLKRPTSTARLTHQASTGSHHVEPEEDYSILVEQFSKLKSGNMVSFQDFVKSDEIANLVSQQLLSKSEVQQIWTNCLKDTHTKATFDDFVTINKEIDNLFEDESDVDGVPDTSSSAGQRVEDIAQSRATPMEDREGSLEEDDEDGEFYDPWDSQVQLSDLFESDFLAELSGFCQTGHTTNAGAAGGGSKTDALQHTKDSNRNADGIHYETFRQWSFVTELLSAGSIDLTCLQDVWAEAVTYQQSKTPGISTSSPSLATTAHHRPGMGATEDGPQSALIERIDYDTLVRAVYRVEQVVRDIEQAVGALSQAEVEQYYRHEFRRLCGVEEVEKEGEEQGEIIATSKDGRSGTGISSGGGSGDVVVGGTNAAAATNNGSPAVLSWPRLLQWGIVKEMLRDQEIRKEDLLAMWDALPKERLTAVTVNPTGKGFAERSSGGSGGGSKTGGGMNRKADKEEEWGIGEDAFVMLNNAIEDSLEVRAVGTDVENEQNESQ